MTLARLKRVETGLVQALEDVRAEIAAEEARLAEAVATPAVVPSPPSPAKGIQDPAAFFAAAKANPFGGKLLQSQVDACNAIMDACRGMPVSWAAYCLATAMHEPGAAMVPNVENLNYSTAARIRQVWPSRFPTDASAKPFVKNPRGLANEVYNGRMGNRPGSDDGWNTRGRGLVHITGVDNYARADRELGLNGALMSNPDLADQLDIAVKALVVGMDEGWFTGKGMNSYLPPVAGREHFTQARRIVNGLDRADHIAGLALAFQDALIAGRWAA